MKKLLILAVMAMGTMTASAGYYKTSCGKVGMTIDPEAMSSNQEFLDYLNDLNRALCGEDGNVKYVRTYEEFLKM